MSTQKTSTPSLDTLGTLRTSVESFQKLLIETALSQSGGWVHSDIYIRIDDDKVQTLAAKGGRTVLSYNTYSENFFDNLTVEGDEEVETLLNVERTMEYLNVADDGASQFELDFLGAESDRLAKQLKAQGGLNVRVSLPQADKVFERIPTELPDRFSDDNEFLSPSDNTHSLFITTTAGVLSKIFEAVELDNKKTFYPIHADQDGLRLEVGERDGGRDAIWGGLTASNLEWTEDDPPEKIRNHYGPGFEPTFEKTLTGEVELQLSPGVPMAVVQESDSRTVRHILSTVKNK